jgi:hypothetical protein
VAFLTYISIEAHLTECEATGKLTRFVPRSRKKSQRRLYFSQVFEKKINDPTSAVNILIGRGKIEAALVRWTLGERVYADEKRKPRFLKRLEAPPPEVWEIRITEPNAQARIFGRFVTADSFIVTDIHTRQMLGKKGSPSWISACQNCVNEWVNIFSTAVPFSGITIHDYVTENCDDFDI